MIRDYGFGTPKINIGRITALDKIIITRPKEVINRRRTVGFRENLDSSGSASTKNTPPVPQLIPLKSALKMPSQAPFDVRNRKSMFPRINVPSTSRSPTIPKGTTAQMILNRVSTPGTAGTSGTSSQTLSTTIHANDVTLPSPVGSSPMGRLRYSSDSD